MKSNKHIVLLSGEKRSGKDTVGQMMIDYLLIQGKRVMKTAFAAKLKEAANALVKIVYDTDCFNVDQFSDESIRQNEYPLDINGQMNWGGKQICLRTVLQQFGTEVCREHIDKDIWVNAVIKFIEQNIDENDVIIITDARFPNEINGVTLKFGGKYMVSSVLIRRPGLSNCNDLHESESFFNQMEQNGMYNYIIDNNTSLSDLQKKTSEIIDVIISKGGDDNYSDIFRSIGSSGNVQTWWGC